MEEEEELDDVVLGESVEKEALEAVINELREALKISFAREATMLKSDRAVATIGAWGPGLPPPHQSVWPPTNDLGYSIV